MKFANLTAFEKHLTEVDPERLAHIYMVAAPVDFERKKIVESIVKAIKPDSTVRFDANEAPIERVIAQLNTLSLLGRSPLTILDGCEKLKKNDLGVLAEYLVRPSPFSYLILSAPAFKGYQDLYQKAMKDAIFVDLSDEKPWDKEKRLREYLSKEASAQGKSLAPDLLAHLLAEVGPDMATLNAELFKLMAYTGSRLKITLDDAQAICTSYHTFNGWQLAEGIVWDMHVSRTPVDTAVLIPLIGQVRYHLQIGMQICEGTAPYLKSAQAEKFTQLARKYGIAYFRKSLESLFELELAAKSSGIAPDLLLDVFIAKLTSHKKHAYPTSQPS